MPHRANLRDVTRPHVEFQAEFDSTYEAFKDVVGPGARLSEETLVPLIMKAIKLVEKVSKQSRDRGYAKRELVLALITKLIAHSTLQRHHKVLLQDTLEMLGPSIIDGLIEADHGKLLRHGWVKLKAFCTCQ